MLLLTSVTDLIQMLTASAGTVKYRADYMDNNAGTVTPGHTTNAAAVTTIATTTIVASPASSVQRNVKGIEIANTDGAISNLITVRHTDGTNPVEMWAGTLLAGEKVVMDELGVWTKYSSVGLPQTSGLPMTTKGDLVVYDTAPNRLGVGTDGQVLAAAASAAKGMKWVTLNPTNRSISTVAAAYAADTYLAGSSIVIPAGGPIVGTVYRCKFDMVKTAAGVAAFTVNVRYGTAGTVADASILALAFAVGTAVADTGLFEINLHFRTVGSGTAAVIVATIKCDHHLAATGLITTGASGYGQVTSVSAGFDSTPAGSILGISVNGGAAFAGTNTIVETDTANLAI